MSIFVKNNVYAHNIHLGFIVIPHSMQNLALIGLSLHPQEGHTPTVWCDTSFSLTIFPQ